MPSGFRRRGTDDWPILSLAVEGLQGFNSLAVSICKPRKAFGSLVNVVWQGNRDLSTHNNAYPLLM